MPTPISRGFMALILSPVEPAMSLSRRFLCLVIAFVYLFPGALAHAQAYTSVVIFGDSLCDTGNDAAISSGIYGPSAQVPGPATGYTNGRFTDGLDTAPAARNYLGVWIEQLASQLAAKPVINYSLAGGTNYAAGFATTGTGTTLFTYGPGNALSFSVPNMGQQVATYLATHPTITSKTLFVVWGGANDLIAATTSAQIQAAAQRDAALVQQLISAGATDIIVPNLPPLGLVPRFNGSITTSAPATAAAQGFDQALAAYLAALPAANPGVTLHIFQLDTYTLFNTLVGPPVGANLANVTAMSQGNTAINPDTYLFWDDLHPTTYGHSLLATQALHLIGTPLTTTSAVTSSNANANLNASVTFTDTVTASTGTPIGTVTFMDGANVLSSVLLSGSTTSATAAYTTSTLTAGTHNITAVFTGVNGYVSSTSAPIPEIVTAPALTAAFISSSLTLTGGQSGTDTLTLSPVGGYTGTASVTCSVQSAPDMNCAFTSGTLTFSGNNAQQLDALTVTTNNTVAALRLPSTPGHSPFQAPATLFAFLLFPFAGLAGFAATRRRSRNLRLLLLLATLSLGATLGITGCSAGNSDTPSGTYTVQANITANGTTITQPLTVVVQ
jgi:outer membrane lipase/esterase